jgi:ribonuclease BN (tRNA processing enzyme)
MSIEVIMLGTGSPRPNLNRSGPSQVLNIDGQPILIDCGEGVVNQLMKSNIPLSEINHLFFTHLHADHVYGYGHFLVAGWGSGRKKLTVVGPPGTKRLHNLVLEMFKEDINYRSSLGFPTEGILDVNVIEVDPSQKVPCEIPAEVTAAPMIHNVQTFAYRFQMGNKSVVFSGDTAPTEKLVGLSDGADVLVHDSCLTTTSMYNYSPRPELKKVWENLQTEHCTPEQAANTARKANVKKLILTHFLPDIDVNEIYAETKKIYDGTVIVPEDNQVIYMDDGKDTNTKAETSPIQSSL